MTEITDESHTSIHGQRPQHPNIPRLVPRLIHRRLCDKRRIPETARRAAAAETPPHQSFPRQYARAGPASTPAPPWHRCNATPLPSQIPPSPPPAPSSPRIPPPKRGRSPSRGSGTYPGTPPPEHTPAAAPPAPPPAQSSRPARTPLPPYSRSAPAAHPPPASAHPPPVQSPRAASRSPSSRVNPFQLPGCSTRNSAPHASPRSTSPRNAATEFTRTLSVLLHRLIR